MLYKKKYVRILLEILDFIEGGVFLETKLVPIDPSNARKHRNDKNGVMAVTCPDCGDQRYARKDYVRSKIGLCRSCASMRGSKAPKPKRGFDKSCKYCSQSFYVCPCESDSKFCSRDCANSSKRIYKKEKKICKECANTFEFSLKPFSNSNGNYCSLKCRNNSYARINGYGYKGHRPRWTSVRKTFLKKNQFCFSCGVSKVKLHIHHIIPYRICKNNEIENLVTLCPSCHSKEEKFSYIISKLPAKTHETCMYIRQAVLQDRWMLHANKQA